MYTLTVRFVEKTLERKTVRFWVGFGKRFYKKNDKRSTKVPKAVRETVHEKRMGTVRYGHGENFVRPTVLIYGNACNGRQCWVTLSNDDNAM